MKEHNVARESIEQYRRHLLFFAQISDAKSAAEVKEILVAYTVPPVSFALKRESGQAHFLITSYLGYGAGGVDNSRTPGEKNSSGIYAPIGIEYSKGTGDGGSLSLMVAPFDFGYPVSLRLNGIEEDVKLDDTIAPSVFLSYGLANYPISMGVAYQRGRASSISGAVEERILFVVAFDLPLFTLY